MKKSSHPPIPVLLGPTASGKTAIGIELANLIDGEIISVDSRKIYRYLPIGTATPKGAWEGKAYVVRGVAHYLMDCVDPASFYTAGDFVADTGRLISDIQARGKTPVLVGGTGFYFKALAEGLPPLPVRDPALRASLEKEEREKGLPFLFDRLKNEDPAAADAISSQDRHKIIRALEVITLTGRPYSEGKKGKKKTTDHAFQVFSLDVERDFLEKRIRERSQQMAQDGMIEEAEALMAQGYAPECPALSSFGYREAVQVIQGTLPRQDFLPLLIKGTLQYAKRQRTWLRTQIASQPLSVASGTTAEEISLKMSTFLRNSCYNPSS